MRQINCKGTQLERRSSEERRPSTDKNVTLFDHIVYVEYLSLYPVLAVTKPLIAHG